MMSKNILITGATGFLGNRLAERLALGTDYNVTAMVHKFSGPGLARLARLPINLIQADLLNEESLLKAAENCHIIVHLAYGTAGDEAVKREITVSGTENILKVALKKKVRKVLHFSTAAVHGLDPKGSVIDESAPFNPGNEIYRFSKAQAEKLVWHYHKEYGLPVVIFRPPIIYGPYGAYWTARIIKEIQTGAILVNGGTGAANLVYVDNLIDAVLLAMENDAADGEAFNVVDDDRMTWGQVYEAYANMIDAHPPLRSMSVKEIEIMSKGDAPNDLGSWFVKPLLLIPQAIKTSLRSPEMRSKMMEIPWLRFMKDRMPRPTLDKMKYGENGNKTATDELPQPVRPSLPNNDLVELYSAQGRFSNNKIKKVLGYEQRIPFNEALDLIRAWLQYQRLIP
ncbi:MAG: NAD-dependent epimerase/dehydratase family protein [Actinobacteria bacterium]|nr:NAD-dependent epimerase/dehydratase family protein [Actinomycetota bacterium]